MRLALPISILLVAVTAGALAVAVWASVADAPWEDSADNASRLEDSADNANVLCEDALERRRATEDALQRPVYETQIPLSALRGRDPGDPFRDEITRLESKLSEIELDIQRFCE